MADGSGQHLLPTSPLDQWWRGSADWEQNWSKIELEKNWEQKLDDEEKFETWIRNRNCIYKLETEIGGRKYWKKKV